MRIGSEFQLTSKSKLRALYVACGIGPHCGGLYKDIPGLCREMARRGWDVLLLATDRDGEERLDVPIGIWVDGDGFRTQYFSTVSLPGGWDRFALCGDYRRTLRREVPRADVVHVYSMYHYPSFWAGSYARKYAVPYILEPHGTLDDYMFARHKLRKRLFEYLFERRNFREAAAIRFLSDTEAAMARDNLGVSLNAAVIPTGIEPSEFRPSNRAAEVMRRYAIPENRRLLVFVGRLHIKKGIDLLIQAFIQLASVDDTLHLVVIGPDDGMEQKIRSMVAEARLDSRVTFTGMVIGQDKIDLMSVAAVAVIPSYTENFCNVAIEAMALRIPVVVSSGVAIAEQIAKAGAGIVAAPAVDEIAKAIRRVIDEPGAIRRFGLAGRELTSRCFSWTAVGANIDTLYRDLIRVNQEPSRKKLHSEQELSSGLDASLT
jgi:glycosyltransferase involved in cell wall biosynthesis